MYNNYIQETPNTLDAFSGAGEWTIVALILAIVGGILVYFLFLKKEDEVSPKVQKLKDLLNFKIMIIEPILKVLYLILTLFVILLSFSLISVNFLLFLLVLLIAPLALRLVYEASLMLVMMWKNTKEINETLKRK